MNGYVKCLQCGTLREADVILCPICRNIENEARIKEYKEKYGQEYNP